jgi:hypothetical protein
MMNNDAWEKLSEDLAARVEQLVIARVQASLEKFLRDGVKLVYPEKEAAQFLNVGIERLQAWRRRQLISASQYPKGRLRKDEEDGLGDDYFYDIASLLSFHQKYLKPAVSPDAFEIKTELQPLGAEITETRRLRAVSNGR